VHGYPAPAERFEEHRDHLRSVAYRMLGSRAEADDAVQDAWLRLSRADAGDIENLGGWLTTVTARICLNMLRARRRRPEDALDDLHLPDPEVSRPDEEAVLAESVGLALLVVLDTMAPAERLAFVLHDMFSLPFEDIAPIVERTPAATRQRASRGRAGGSGRPSSRPPSGTWLASARWSTPSSGRHGAATSTPWWRCAIPTWCCEPTPGTGARRSRSWCGGPRRWPGRRSGSPSPTPSWSPPWSMERPGWSSRSAADRSRSWGFTVSDGRIREIDAVAGPERVNRTAAAVLGAD
jgi:RNA polymerase sigma-70 factor (ECF subfamily)